MKAKGLARLAKLPKKLLVLFKFFVSLIIGIVVSNLRVAHEVITRKPHSRPGLIAIPLDVKTPFQITLLANVISLTPGTLTIDVSEDRRLLFLHAMFIHDIEKLRADIKDKFEKPIMEIFN